METTLFFPGRGANEMFLAFDSTPRADFAGEAEELLERCRELSAGMTPIMLRFHLSDITNQAPVMLRLAGEKFPGIPLSSVGQPPVGGSRIALEGWFADRPLSGLRFLPGGDPGDGDSFAQMDRLFRDLASSLPPGCSTADHVLRTWIYCRDVDNRYAGLVRARREYFTSIGLTEKTHYIASTGIAGCAARPGQLVMMDSLIVPGVEPGQIEYMHAPENLSPTHIYGVTFERGVRLIHRDRSHCFLSGTASIDKHGEILYPGDVSGQTERVMDNVEALLDHHRASVEDLRLAVVYLRDAADREKVETILGRRLGGRCVWVTLHAPVCRPGWLVELEGIAVNGRGEDAMPEFR